MLLCWPHYVIIVYTFLKMWWNIEDGDFSAEVVTHRLELFEVACHSNSYSQTHILSEVHDVSDSPALDKQWDATSCLNEKPPAHSEAWLFFFFFSLSLFFFQTWSNGKPHQFYMLSTITCAGNQIALTVTYSSWYMLWLCGYFDFSFLLCSCLCSLFYKHPPFVETHSSLSSEKSCCCKDMDIIHVHIKCTHLHALLKACWTAKQHWEIGTLFNK